jgi:hypothetical protein
MKLKQFLSEEGTSFICNECGNPMRKETSIIIEKKGKQIAVCRNCYEKYKAKEETK